ncbi:MAG: hypothetical protein ISQ32_00705 [Rickettsiales bacterium]|nr:hypothetical protein [Rickettsiales bacterium]
MPGNKKGGGQSSNNQKSYSKKTIGNSSIKSKAKSELSANNDENKTPNIAASNNKIVQKSILSSPVKAINVRASSQASPNDLNNSKTEKIKKKPTINLKHIKDRFVQKTQNLLSKKTSESSKKSSSTKTISGRKQQQNNIKGKEFVAAKFSREKSLIEDDRLRIIEPIYINNHVDRSSVSTIPKNFTNLFFTGNSKPREYSTPERVKDKSSSRGAKTTPSSLMINLVEAINDLKLKNKLLRSHGDKTITGNLACAQLSIIPQDKSKKQVFINVSGSEDGATITPSALYGNSEHTFPALFELQKDYLKDDMLKDPNVRKVIGGLSRKVSSPEIEDAGSKVRIKTHHSEQFIVGALYKSLLALKNSGVNLEDTNFVLDIATKLAPCNHCINRINDFLNLVRDELFPGNNFFVTRVSWLNEYQKGNSPSEVSENYENQDTKLTDEFVEISDPKKNYMLFCKVTEEMARNTDLVLTASGRKASRSSSVLSSNHRAYHGSSANINISTGDSYKLLSPPKSKNKLFSNNMGLSELLGIGFEDADISYFAGDMEIKSPDKPSPLIKSFQEALMSVDSERDQKTQMSCLSIKSTNVLKESVSSSNSGFSIFQEVRSESIVKKSLVNDFDNVLSPNRKKNVKFTDKIEGSVTGKGRRF